MKRPPIRKILLRLSLLVVVLAALVVGGMRLANGYWPWASQSVRDGAKVESYVSAVSRHMVLPDETPTVATVTDAETLKQQQAFFSNASDGDVLLIYSSTRQAILYSPSRDLVVNVGPISVDQQADTQSGVSAQVTGTTASSTTTAATVPAKKK